MLLRTIQIIVYLLLLVILTAVMLWSRAETERRFATEEAQEEWQTWRDQVRDNQVDGGSVQRKEPKSPRPPALVLLRDHFGACLAIALIISSALYWTFAFLIVGVLSQRSSDHDPTGEHRRS